MMKLILAGIFSVTALNAYGDGPKLMRATESSFLFENGTRVSMKVDKFGVLDFVEITIEGKSFKISQTDFGKIHDPLINSVQLSSPRGTWELTVSYALGHHGLAIKSSELTICFGKAGYIEKRSKIPTGKDAWIYKRQKAGMAEEDDGRGGILPAIE